MRVDALALLLDVVPQVLEQQHAALGRVRACRLRLRPDAVSDEADRPCEELLEGSGDWSQRALRLPRAVRPPQVGAEDDRLGARLEAVPDALQRALDSRSVGDFARVGLVLRHVEVAADEHALPGHAHAPEQPLVELAACPAARAHVVLF